MLTRVEYQFSVALWCVCVLRLPSCASCRRAAELLGVDAETLVNAMSFRRIQVSEKGGVSNDDVFAF